VRLEEIANVKDSVEDERTISWMYNSAGSERAINLFVMRQPGSNIVEVIDKVKQLIPVFNAQLPPSIKLAMRGDRGKTIRERSGHPVHHGADAVPGDRSDFVFLRNGSATLIPSLACRCR